MRRVDEDDLEIAKESAYNDLTDTVIIQINELDYVQKAEVLVAAANHVLTTARRDT
ncbi:hypothetical protein [uncultured Nostoc sp.]|uniref:hypothetical protein n=1 Tax=uncultured Nostoc sp. TaxID=340711 RepID=UPI0035C9C277